MTTITVSTSLLLLLATCIVTSWGYSFEERLPLYKKGSNGSTFGYSSQMHKYSEDDPNSSMFAVGAPTDVATIYQPDTDRPGGVYACPFTSYDNDCQRVTVDQGGSSIVNNKSGEWLGITLKSKGAGKNLIVCAHRTHGEEEGKPSGPDEKAQMCGRCFALNGSRSDLKEIEGSTLTQNFCAIAGVNLRSFWARKGMAFSQTGVALDVDGPDNEYLVGGPGAFDWKGAVYDIVSHEAFFESEVNVYRTERKNDMTYDSYNGFAVARSKNMIDGEEDVIISGAPRYNFTGGVVFYRKIAVPTGRKDKNGNVQLNYKLQNITILEGIQLGSSFGYSLLVTDINNDGLDDLLVGAPQYYHYSSTAKKGGAVYVYIRQSGLNITDVEPQVLLGNLDSFFGQTIASIGDFDQDGYNDVAIAAPRDGESGKVYIYRGSADGKLKLSQTLDGAKFNDVSDKVKEFGVSISGRVDVDNNKYPDILIGTKTDFVVHLRARPIVTMESQFNISSESINLLNPVSCSDGKEDGDSCFTYKLCFKYEARHEEYTEELPVKYTIAFDQKFFNDATNKSRVVAVNSSSSVVTMVTTLPLAGEWFCEDEQEVKFLKAAKDRFSPFEITLEYNLLSEEADLMRESPGDELFSMIDDPILDEDYESKHTRSVELYNNCGADGLCQSNLQVDGQAPIEINVGKNKILSVYLNVTNEDGEEAHQASVTLTHPNTIFYEGFETADKRITCSKTVFDDTTVGGTSQMKCDVGNPYVSGRSDTIRIDFDVAQISTDLKLLEFEAQVGTTSKNPVAEPLFMMSNVIIEVSVELTSLSQPKQIRYYDNEILGESAIDFLDQIGPSVTYSYYVKNIGTQEARDLQLNIDYPRELYNEKWLLYLTTASVLQGQKRVGSCETKYINELQKKIGQESAKTLAVVRAKRDADEVPRFEALIGKEPLIVKSLRSSGHEAILSCDSGANCARVVCDLEPLNPKQTYAIVLQARVWNSTFLEEFDEIDLVAFQTDAKVTSKQENVRVVGTPEAQIETEVDHAKLHDEDDQPFPWWYILIGILIALVIYIFILVFLIQCGFFKRKEFPDRDAPLDEDDVIEETREDKPLAPHSSV